MVNTILRSIFGAAILMALLMCWSSMSALAGIRMDGTEIQSGSQVIEPPATRASSDATTTSRGMRIKLVYTFGQPVLAFGSIENSNTGEAVKIGLGYDFNAQQSTDFGCTCPFQGDINLDGQKDGVDLSAIIDALFFTGSSPHDPLCPLERFDVDCDGWLTPLDLNYLIEFLFFAGPPPCDPCDGL